MVRVIQLDDNGDEVAAIEVDDFTVEILYSGIASMLRDAASSASSSRPTSSSELSKEGRQRRQRIISRINS